MASAATADMEGVTQGRRGARKALLLVLAVAATAGLVIWKKVESDRRYQPGLTSEGVVTADDGSADDDDHDATTSTAPAPASIGKAVSAPVAAAAPLLLASLPAREATPTPAPPRHGEAANAHNIVRARQEMTACQQKYAAIRDYSCVFHKRELISGALTSPHVMSMKVRTDSGGIYFKFVYPNKGREAIYVPGKNGGKILAHDVGLGRLLAGTMRLDPKGSMAMEDNRHPVTEAGIGELIKTVRTRWDLELDPNEAQVEIHSNARVKDRACTLIETTHSEHRDDFMFHRVKLYIDHELGLPIRFEAYDWPKAPGAEPQLVEEYSYTDIKLGVGLTDVDFDPANPLYSFGRF